jgi:anti-sigma-K factor RskA
MTSRDDLHLLAGAYALGALDEPERVDFENYLLTSEEARAEVATLTDTAVMLGLATQPIAPPPALKASLMAKIAATPQLSRVDEVSTPSNVASFADARALRAVHRPVTKAERRWYARPATFLVAAAAAIAIFIGGNVIGSVNHNSQISQQASSYTEITTASDSQHAERAITGGGKATLVWSNSLGRSAIVLDKLAALPSDKTYELWYITGSVAKPAGTFVPSDSGKSTQVLDGTMTAGDTVGITIEPAGGSKTPTSGTFVSIPTV